MKGLNGISSLPISLQKILQETEYPPERPSLLQSTTRKVVMIVDSVSPTPFALLRRANHFQYRDDDRMLQEYAEYEDPIQALSDECRRVLKSISNANQSQVSNTKDSTGLTDASWSRFEDIGFSSVLDQGLDQEESSKYGPRKREQPALRSTPYSKTAGPGGRPTTPSWADFLSSGFVDESKPNAVAPLLLPPDKQLPPIDTRGRSSQSHSPRLENNSLEPGELASITKFDLDDTFWWVWISSLASEETSERKAAFGRCALIETHIRGAKWLVMEEMVKGAAEPVEGAYIAEKKSFWSRSKKTKAPERAKSAATKPALEPLRGHGGYQATASKASIGPDQQARIAAAAALLQEKQRQQDHQEWNTRRGRMQPDMASQKTNSVFTLQPVLMSEASSAMKWANKYDRGAILDEYLANNSTNKGLVSNPTHSNGYAKSQDNLQRPQVSRAPTKERDLPPPPEKDDGYTRNEPSFPPTPAPVDERDMQLSEKAAEVGLPEDTHPLHRKPVGSPSSPPPKPAASKQSTDVAVTPHSEELDSSPEAKAQHKKLQKKEPSGGFGRLFGRNKNRASGVPVDASEKLNGPQGSLKPPQAGLGRRLSNMRKKAPSPAPQAAVASTTSFANSRISEDSKTPIPTPRVDPNERSYDPSLRDSLSRVDTIDAQEARQAFSSFDQGPLDVPAFVPADSPRNSYDSAAPPPISRERSKERRDDSVPEVAQSIAPEYPVSPAAAQPGDRWAQIRKNAAERAAAAQRQSEDQSRTGQSRTTDDGETSGEESES